MAMASGPTPRREFRDLLLRRMIGERGHLTIEEVRIEEGRIEEGRIEEVRYAATLFSGRRPKAVGQAWAAGPWAAVLRLASILPKGRR